MFNIFKKHVLENRQLYSPNDLGEVYAISLAETLGAFALVTDDIKQGGPYMSLLQFPDNEVMPFTFIDILILNYLEGSMTAEEIMTSFNRINECSELHWNFKSHLARFIRRFFSGYYQEDEKTWMADLCREHHISAKKKFTYLKKLL